MTADEILTMRGILILVENKRRPIAAVPFPANGPINPARRPAGNSFHH
jgi:hypothetical protein